MLIFLDSNILFDNWQLRNVNFTVLFNFIANEDAKLLMSELVILETENNQKRKFETIKTSLKKELKSINQFNSLEIDYDLSLIEQPYQFKTLLESKLNKYYIKYFGFDEILQSTVVSRALNSYRPFRDGEKGYRDTLIWLSFLKYLSDNKVEESVIFINNNSNDFYDKTKSAFHTDLAKDIEDLGLKCQIVVFNSLSDFISVNVDKDIHALVHSDLYGVENQIERLSEDYFNALSVEDLRNFMRNYDTVISSFISISQHWFEIDEGMEDPEILKSSHIKNNAVYVNYKYWLRICTLSLTLTAEEYVANASQIKAPYNFVANESEFVTLEIFLQVNMRVSFEYDTEMQDVDDFSVDFASIINK